MSGELVAVKHWRALDRDGEDTCRLSRLETGWMLVGHARFRDGAGWAALDYVVRVGLDWCTQTADVTGEYCSETVGWRFVHTDGTWTVNDEVQPDLQGASDVDLSFTPATNLMPIRRLPEVGRVACTAAWLRLPGPQISPLTQSYTRERGGLVRYDAVETDYQAHLRVDAHGFVDGYPGLWDAVHDV